MDPAVSLAATLDQAMARPASPSLAVAGWRFELRRGRSTSLGIKHNVLAGAYRPPAQREEWSGSAYLIWTDGRRSFGKLDRQVLQDVPSRLPEWRAAAFEEPDGPEILEPRPVPTVEVFDPTAARLLDEEPAALFDLVERGRSELAAAGVEFVDAGVTASEGWRAVYNSRGLSVSYPDTSFTFWLSADRVYSNGYGKRRRPREDEIAHVIADVSDMAAALRAPGSGSSGETRILLDPGVAEQFVSTFVLSNLSGSAVANGQSAYSLSDFLGARAVFRDDFSVLVDPTRPLEPGTTACTAEGVPAAVQYLVQDGMLVTPVLDLKYAGRTGLLPTPQPRGGGGLFYGPPQAGEFAELLAGVERGLLVLSLLGMHTQDAVSGNYSVTANQALVIDQGRLAGRTRAVLAGNFFDNLRDPRTRFGHAPYEPNPGMLLHAHATVG